MIAREKPAAPAFARDDVVSYTDHFGRVVQGRVKHIETSWPSYAGDRRSAPQIKYTIEHPTYRNREMHVGEDKIIAIVSHL